MYTIDVRKHSDWAMYVDYIIRENHVEYESVGKDIEFILRISIELPEGTTVDDVAISYESEYRVIAPDGSEYKSMFWEEEIMDESMAVLIQGKESLHYTHKIGNKRMEGRS